MPLQPIQLERPLAVIDLETTGTNIDGDRIVQIAAVVVNPDGSERAPFTSLVNPGMPIPSAATAVHGIDDERVALAPTFAEVAPGFVGYVMGCDFAGYNIESFDLPLLVAELKRAEYTIPGDRKIIDAYRVFTHQEDRTLATAVRWYLDDELVGAHDALADVEATCRVLFEQARRYGASTVEDLDALSRGEDWIDRDGRFLRGPDGETLVGFGKHRGQPLANVPTSYLRWMAVQAFAADTLGVVRGELGRRSCVGSRQ